MTVEISKLVHGGQGLGDLSDGKKVFVWNALPSEEVEIVLFKSRRSYAEARAVNVLKPSKHRIEPLDVSYLATSPWQIMDFAYENQQKALILQELFVHEGIVLAEDLKVEHVGSDFHYRNKMEYSFYGDDKGLHLALYNRGTHQKQIVSGSSLAMPSIDIAANDLVSELQQKGVRAGDLKSVIVRCNQESEVVAALFVKPTSFPKISLPSSLKGLRIYHSNPKSPASVATKLLKVYGDDSMSDKVLGLKLNYDVTGFFQVNLPIFEQAVESIKDWMSDKQNIVDMYAGVGSIGLVIKNTQALVELDESNVEMAKINAKNSSVKVVHASTEKALEFIIKNSNIIVDPPRAGLHKDVVSRIISEKPKTVCYLSCNPATQARDIKILQESGYKIDNFKAYNFFPRTPHIETLALLKAL